MNKIFMFALSIVIVLPGCARQSRHSEHKQLKVIARAQNNYKIAVADFGQVLPLVDLPDDAQRDKQLKMVVIEKNSEWKKHRWSAERWLGSGLNEFESFPFISYKTALIACIDKMGQTKRRLEKIKGYAFPTAALVLIDIEALIPKLKALFEMVVQHDRYLQEKDKWESIIVPRTVRVIKY
ncbi:MAG: hypothetical protein NTX86_02610 [Candidatus Dependentiae bacterium]|nr:hypothetical protein [Candidatus Dependentiae bacterium]